MKRAFLAAGPVLALALAPVGCGNKKDPDKGSSTGKDDTAAKDPTASKDDKTKEAGSNEPADPCAVFTRTSSLAYKDKAEWVPGGEPKGPCPAPERTKAEGAKGEGGEFSVGAKGPAGSGRMWMVRVGPGKKLEDRGLCIETSTAGFRSIAGSKTIEATLPLKWAEDVDGDGNFELVLWSSVDPGGQKGTPLSEHALVADVYRVKADGVHFDGKLTLEFWKRMSGMYEKAAVEEEATPMEKQSRKKVADFLAARIAECSKPAK